MKQNSLDQAEAARAAGISLDYINVNGEKEAISEDTKRALLSVMGVRTTQRRHPCRRSRYSAAAVNVNLPHRAAGCSTGSSRLRRANRSAVN